MTGSAVGKNSGKIHKQTKQGPVEQIKQTKCKLINKQKNVTLTIIRDPKRKLKEQSDEKILKTINYFKTNENHRASKE